MSRDANGNYTLPAGNPVAGNTVIEATWANNTMQDVANALTDSLSRSGQGGMTAPLKFADGAVGAPGLSWSNEPTTGFWRASQFTMNMALGGQQRASFGQSNISFGPAATPWSQFTAIGHNVRGLTEWADSAGTIQAKMTPRVGAAGVGAYISVVATPAQGWRLQGTVPTAEFYSNDGVMRGEISCVASGMNFYGSTNGFGFYKGLTSASPTLLATLNDTGFSGPTSFYTKADSTLGLCMTKSAVSSAMVTEFRCGAASPGHLMQDTGIQGFCRTNGAGAWATWLVYTDNSGNLTAAANVTAFSDERLKDVEVTFIGGLSMLRQMGAYRFTWKDIEENGVRRGQKDIGLIAQQVRPWIPEAVVEDQTTEIDGTPTLTLNYSKMVVPLISAVQELASMVESADIRHDQELKKLRDWAEGCERRMQTLQEDLEAALTRLQILEGK